jgi:gas vesicle protein
MDVATFLSSLIAGGVVGGVIGGLVSLRVAGKESEDRRAALALERQKWEHGLGESKRASLREACTDALSLMDDQHAIALETERLDRDPPTEASIARMEEAQQHVHQLRRRHTYGSLFAAKVPPESVGVVIDAFESWMEYVTRSFAGQFDAELGDRDRRQRSRAILVLKQVLAEGS